MNANTSSNRNASRNALREALLQQITPEQITEAEARALAILAAHPTEEPPQSAPESPAENSPKPLPKAARHSRKCKICNSPDREDIDQAYIHWVPLRRIVFEYRDVSSDVALYRHAIATGLFTRRRSRFQHALDRIIEQAGDTRPTADAVIRAIRASSILNEQGRWIDPPRHVIVEHRQTVSPTLSPALLETAVPRDITQTSLQNLPELGLKRANKELT